MDFIVFDSVVPPPPTRIDDTDAVKVVVPSPSFDANTGSVCQYLSCRAHFGQFDDKPIYIRMSLLLLWLI